MMKSCDSTAPRGTFPKLWVVPVLAKSLSAHSWFWARAEAAHKSSTVAIERAFFMPRYLWPPEHREHRPANFSVHLASGEGRINGSRRARPDFIVNYC